MSKSPPHGVTSLDLIAPSKLKRGMVSTQERQSIDTALPSMSQKV